MNENLPTSNMNPGDLRFAGQPGATQGKGGFAAFATPQAGFGALLNQLQLNIKNNPNESLVDFSEKYAPSSDGNNPGQYAADVANQLKVSPATPIGQLQPVIGQFAEAISKNEGYQASQTPQAPQATQPPQKSPGLGILGGVGALGAGLLGAIGGAIKSTPLLPIAGATLGGAGGELIGGPVGAIAGESLGAGLGSAAQGALGGGEPAPQAVAPEKPSALAGSLNDILGTSVGGTAVQQEAKARGLPDVGTIIEKNGMVPETTPEGNYDKVSPELIGKALTSQQATVVEGIAKDMGAQSNVADVESVINDLIDDALKGTGRAEATRDLTTKELGGLIRDASASSDQSLNSTQVFKNAADWLAYRRSLSQRISRRSGAAYALPDDQRSALQFIERGVAKHLGNLAELHGKGNEWKAAHKKMEELILARKAIAKLPKKAQRDLRKELMHELLGAAAGAAIGKTFGHGLIGGALGAIVERRLGRKHYRNLAKEVDKNRTSKEKQNEVHSRTIIP